MKFSEYLFRELSQNQVESQCSACEHSVVTRQREYVLSTRSRDLVQILWKLTRKFVDSSSFQRSHTPHLVPESRNLSPTHTDVGVRTLEMWWHVSVTCHVSRVNVTLFLGPTNCFHIYVDLLRFTIHQCSIPFSMHCYFLPQSCAVFFVLRKDVWMLAS